MPAWTRPAAAITATFVALAPVIAVVVQRAGRAYLPMQDPAVVDLRVRDVLTFSGNTPLVGIYSHFGWSHPGPAMFYLVAPFTWLFGNPAWATLVGFALLQGVAIAWTARLAWVSGGVRWTITWMAIVTLSYVATGPSILQQPWNPNVAFPFFTLFLLQCWVVARGDSRRLLGFVFVGSFLVQTHIGYAILVAILGGWAVGNLAVAHRRKKTRIDRSKLLWPSVLFVVMWFPVLVLDPILHSPSNIQKLVSYFITSPNHARGLGLSTGLGYLATEFRWLPPWLGGADKASIFTGSPAPASAIWLLVPGVLLVLAWRSAWQARGRDLRLLTELVALLLVGCVVSLVLLKATPEPYLYYWRIVAGPATVILTLTVLVDRAVRRRRRPAGFGWTTLVLAVTVAIAAGSLTQRVAAADGPVWPLEPTQASLLAQLQRSGQPDGPTLIRPWGGTIGGVAVGLIDQLAREGKPIFVDRSLAFEFGDDRTATTHDVRWVALVAEDSALYSVGSTYPGARVIALSHPLPVAQQAELVGLQRRVAAVLTANGKASLVPSLGDQFVQFELPRLPGISPEELTRLAQLNAAVVARGCLCSVIKFPPNLSPIGPQPPPQ